MSNARNIKKQGNIIKTEAKSIKHQVCGKFLRHWSQQEKPQVDYIADSSLKTLNPILPAHQVVQSVDHSKKKSKDKTVYCPVCGACLGDRKQLKDHVRSCKETIHSLADKECLDDIEDIASQKSPSKTCKVCGKIFARSANVHLHMRLHRGEKPFTCSTCGKHFRRSDHLRNHELVHVRKEPYECSQCNQSFKRKDHLKYHQINSHGAKIYLNELKSYTRAAQSEAQNKFILCDICGISFASEKNLKNHIRIHSNQGRFTCRHCGKTFNQSSNLNIHQRKHTGETPYKCLNCDQSFTTSSKLKTHARKHTGDQPFTCEICGRLFGENHLLKMHMRIHSSQKSYKCSHCSKTFTHSSTLRAHVRTHTGIKPYKCDQCGDAFAQISSLTYHKRTHSGEKPYSCHICGKSYTRMATLNIHLTRHSGQKRVSCPHCDFKCDTPKHLRKHTAKAHAHTQHGTDLFMKQVSNQTSHALYVDNCIHSPTQANISSSVEVTDLCVVTGAQTVYHTHIGSPASWTNIPLINKPGHLSLVSSCSESLFTSQQAVNASVLAPSTRNIIEDSLVTSQQAVKAAVLTPSARNIEDSLVTSQQALKAAILTPSAMMTPSARNTIQDKLSPMNTLHVYNPPSVLYVYGLIVGFSDMQQYKGTSVQTSALSCPSQSKNIPVLSGFNQPQSIPVLSGPNQPQNIPVLSGSNQPQNIPVLSGSSHPQNIPVSSDSNQPQNISVLSGSNQPQNMPVLSSFNHPQYMSVLSGSNHPQNIPVLSRPNQPQNIPILSGPNQLQSMSSPNQLQFMSGPNQLQSMSGPNQLQSMSGPNQLQSMSGPNHLQSMSDQLQSMSGPNQLQSKSVLSCPNQPQNNIITSDLSPTIISSSEDFNILTQNIHKSTKITNISTQKMGFPSQNSTSYPEQSTSTPNTSCHHEDVHYLTSTLDILTNSCLPAGSQQTLEIPPQTPQGEQFKTLQMTGVPPDSCTIIESCAQSQLGNSEIGSAEQSEVLREKFFKGMNCDVTNKNMLIGSRDRSMEEVDNCEVDVQKRKKKVRVNSLCVNKCKKTVLSWTKVVQAVQSKIVKSDSMCTSNYHKPRATENRQKISKLCMAKVRSQIHSETKCLRKLRDVKQRMERKQHPVECGVCGQTFSRTGNLTTHMRLHNGERPYSCNICHKGYTRSDHLKTHMLLHKGDHSLVCSHCGDVFSSTDQLNLHTVDRHEGKKPFSCNLCLFSCIYLRELKEHIKGHDNNDSFNCDLCQVKFTKVKDLKKHMGSHDGQSAFPCHSCQKSFKESSCLKLHIMTKHTGEKRFKCGICQETYVTAAKLQRHMRNHSGARPYACEFCGKMFIDTCLLKMHVRIHTNEKPFNCKHCEKSFTHRSTLRAHVRIHTGIKPYTCEICGASFAQVSSLTYHKRRHDGVKPYTCHICGNSYTRSTTLSIHMTRHTGQKRVSCPHCVFKCDMPKHLRKHIAKVHGCISQITDQGHGRKHQEEKADSDLHQQTL